MDRGVVTGLIDGDIDNPNVLAMLRIDMELRMIGSMRFVPGEHLGLQLFSMAMITKGPVVMSGQEYAHVLKDIINHTAWRDDTEVLIIDMPAGQADELLLLANEYPDRLVGSFVVMQPAHADVAEKVLEFHKDEGLPVLGLVENFAFYRCPKCGDEEFIFGESKLQSVAEKFGVEPLGSIPIIPDMRRRIEEGRPFLVGDEAAAIELAAERVINSDPRKTGLFEKMKEKVKGVARDLILDVMAKVVETANRDLDISQLRESTGLPGGRILQLNICDRSLNKVKVQEHFKVQEGKLVVVRNPPRVDDRVDIWDKAFVWALIGRRTDTGAPFDFEKAWTSGKMRIFSTDTGTPRAVTFFKAVYEQARNHPSMEKVLKALERVV